jgi:PKD repeat protein
MHQAIPFILLVWLLVGPASGSVYYVAVDGDDDGPGTAGFPWATPGFGSRQLLPGDELVIRNGTYVLSRFDDDIIVPVSGREDAPIVIRGEGGAVLAGRENLFAAVILSSVSHVRLTDLEITSEGGAWFRDGISVQGDCRAIAFERLRIHHIDEFGIDIQNVEGCAIRSCTITHCGFGSIGGPAGTVGGIRGLLVADADLSYAGWYYRGGDGSDRPYSRPDGLGLEASDGPVEIVNTTVAHNRGDGLDSKARNTWIHHCFVENNGCDGIKLWGTGSSVENCIVSGTGDGVGGASPWAGVVISGTAGSSYRLVNTAIHDNPSRLAYPIYVQYDDPEVPIDLLVRNTIVAGGYGPAWFAPSVALTLDHSLVYRPGDADQVYARGRTWTAAECEAGALGDGNLCRDPLFVAPAWGTRGDYRLRAESPAIDAGTSAGAPTTDIDWRPRPRGDGTDMGAYEQGGPGPLPGCSIPPRDLDGDGRYEDVNGNGRRDFADVVALFSNLGWCAEHEPLAFDFNRNGRCDFADVVSLFASL